MSYNIMLAVYLGKQIKPPMNNHLLTVFTICAIEPDFTFAYKSSFVILTSSIVAKCGIDALIDIYKIEDLSISNIEIKCF